MITFSLYADTRQRNNPKWRQLSRIWRFTSELPALRQRRVVRQRRILGERHVILLAGRFFLDGVAAQTSAAVAIGPHNKVALYPMPLRDHFDLVIFDWAGTMVDFGCQAPVLAIKEAFARRGVGVSSQQVRRDMGKAKVDHVRALLADSAVRSAWCAVRAAEPCEADVEALMTDLNPLMREQAERAAQLIDGALDTYRALRAENLKVASSTGYTRDMMVPVLKRAAAQGYQPDHLVCSGETPAGRPSPLMIYRACAELGVWPLSRVVKVDDTEAGVAEGHAAGCFTVGVSASGNGLGLSSAELAALPAGERAARIAAVAKSLRESGADVVIDSVAELIPALRLAQLRP